MSEFRLLIDGKPVATADHFPVPNPATGEIVGLAPLATAEHVDRAVSAAARAFRSRSG